MRFLTAVLLGLLLSVSQASDNEHSIERFSESVIIKTPTKAKIVNPYGDIRIRKADDEEFIYHGVAQSSAEQEVKFSFTHENGVITASVQYSNPEQLSPQDRYDLAIVVPAGVELDIDIERGRLSSKGLDNVVKVQSKTSDITLKTSQAVDLFTETGDISLTVKGSDKNVNSTIQSYQGRVTVMYNQQMPLFQVKTGNHITSNSVALLQTKTQSQRTQLMGQKNANKTIQITTDSGAINLIDLAL
ncbi:hypothetical protein OS175_05150 [Marinicella sp. S1101]|uniref:hypothetical protein n=1 Tax=Marinicella marina TaxID=2996016 RepID=UPI00226092DC|nr:hypothetical protein [Marinicella marina]MCX7553255.1 hypothetical protein [Marinicella marina]MDJ1138987.1 hypothetical protein [Marinicella marina]